jgi:hypothetical protein
LGGRRAAIHQRQPGQRAQAAPIELGEQRVGRPGVRRAVDGRARRPLRDQRVAELARDLLGVRPIGEPRLLGEHAPREPREQGAARAADHAGLGKVEVRVDEAREQHRAGVRLLDRAAGRGGADGDDPAGVVELDRGVRELVEARLPGARTEHAAAKGPGDEGWGYQGVLVEARAFSRGEPSW